MNYKYIVLNTFLIPFAILSNDSARMQELKKARHEKEQELSTIIEKINEAENTIDSMVPKFRNVTSIITAHLDDEQEEAFEEAMQSFQVNLRNALTNKNPIDYSFNKDLVKKITSTALELKRIEYLLIRYTLEYVSLKKLIEQYEIGVQELIDIDNKLNELQKKALHN